MKKTILTLLLLCIGFIGLHAQNIVNPRPRHPHYNSDNPVPIKDNGEGGRINFGLSFAPTFDWMYTQQGMERNGFIVGMRYGVNLNINLTHKKHYYVSTGVFIEQLGGKVKFVDNILIPIDNAQITSTEIQRTCRSNYLTIPIGITLKSKSLSNFYITGNAGIYNSLRFRSTNTDTYKFGNELWSRQKVVSDDAAMIKESAYAGLGFEYSVTKDFRAGISLNYSHGLTNYFKGKGLAQNSITGTNQKAQLGYFEVVLNINFF